MSFVGGDTLIEHSILNILRKNKLLDDKDNHIVPKQHKHKKHQKQTGGDDVDILKKIFDANDCNRTEWENDNIGEITKIFDATNDDYSNNEDDDDSKSTCPVQLDEEDLKALKYLSGGDMENSALDVYSEIQHDIFANTLSEANIQGGQSIDDMVEQSLEGGKSIDNMIESTLQGGAALSEDDLDDYSDISVDAEVDDECSFEPFKPVTLTGGNSHKKPIISKDSFSKYFVRKLH